MSVLPPSGESATAWRASNPAQQTVDGTIRRALTARVGFWRSLIEITIAGNLTQLLLFPLAPLLGSPLNEVLVYLFLGFYVYGAWRLAPGQGGWLRRVLRASAWLVLLGLITGVITWAIFAYVPYSGTFLGIRPEDMQLTLPTMLFNSVFLISSLFVPTRLLLFLWALGQTRLRWQLTFTYFLVALLTTLLIPLTFGVFVGIVSLLTVPVTYNTSDTAQRLTTALTPLIQRGVTPDQLNDVLNGLFAGQTRLPIAPDAQGLDELNDALTLNAADRVTVLGNDGVVLASVGNAPFTAGRPLPTQVQAHSALLFEQARRDGCAEGIPSGGIISDSTACAVTDEQGALLAMVLLEADVNSVAQAGAAFSRVVFVTLFSTNIAINIIPAILLAIVPLSLGIGYLLSRQLTRRMERLATATGRVAAGELSYRVEIDAADETGRLSNDFNAMAARLEEREQALKIEKERVEHLLAANRRLVADVSHELRTPLATLRGYLEALELQHGDQLPQRDMAVIQGEIDRLTRLIDDLFTLARAEAQQLPLTIEPVDVGVRAQQLVETLAPLARREREIEIVSALPSDLPYALADRVRLEQALLNLLQNALRYTPPGGIVALEGASENGVVTITVADTGVGIPADELPLVFERFYRSDSSRARETGGAGLGLALVHELITVMGGTVAVESTPGRGSKFSVRLRSVGKNEEPRTEN